MWLEQTAIRNDGNSASELALADPYQTCMTAETFWDDIHHGPLFYSLLLSNPLILF